MTSSVTVVWPTRTRQFSGPTSALSVTFQFENAAQTQTYATISGSRSSVLTAHSETYTSTVTIPAGAYTLDGMFYSQASGAGVAVATVSVPVSVASSGAVTKPDGTPLGQIAFTSNVKSVVVGAGQSLVAGNQLQLVATAFDGQSNALALTPGSFSFAVTSGSQYLTVTPDGIASGVAAGSAMVQATVDGVTSAAASVSVSEGFTHVFRFTQPTDSIQLTGGSLNGACALGSQFTVEAFVRPTSGNGYIWQQWTDTSMSDIAELSSGNFQTVGTGSGQPVTNFVGSAVHLSGWNHLAWCYDGTAGRLYQNGVLTLTMEAPATFDPIVSGEACAIGQNFGFINDTNTAFAGDLAGFRISNIVRYSGTSFTPPNSPFTADASTLLLVDPSSFTSAPTTFSPPGTQGITATLGAGNAAATSPAWVAYTP